MKGCRALTEGEVSLMQQSFTGTYAARDTALFTLGVKAGFRISELLSLSIGDVWQHGHVTDRVTVRRSHMKMREPGRTVVLHPEAQAALARWLTVLRSAGYGDASTYLFRSRNGVNRPISRRHALRILRHAFEVNQLTGPLGTHAMRKTFAHRVYNLLNHDLLKTQHALGHSDINTTVSYLSFAEEDVDAAILSA